MRPYCITCGNKFIIIAIYEKVLPAITVGKCDDVLFVIVQHRDAALTNIMHTN
jgi:hypothetical protein